MEPKAPSYCLRSDQFLLGPDILVAPVLDPEARRRRVTFPPGRWENQEGVVVEGPQVVDVEAPLEALPWYRKVAE